MNKLSKIASEDIKFRNSSVGLLDLGIGAALILMGIAFLFDAVAVSGSFFLVSFILILVLKQKVVYPRIGYVEHKGMDMKMRKVFTITFVIGVVMLIAATLVYLKVARGQNSQMMRSIAQDWGALILGAVVAFVVVLIGKTLEISRFYYYAALVFCGFAAVEFIPYDHIVPTSFISCGVVIFAIGLYLFIMFIKKYPRLDAEDDE
jgi:hypothetical protein